MVKAVLYPRIFKERFSQLTKETGMNQTQLAKDTGIARKTINEYLNGKSCPAKEILNELARYFRVSEEYLSGESKYRNFADEFAEEIDKHRPEEVKEIRKELKMMGTIEELYELEDYDRGETDEMGDDYTRMMGDILQYIESKTDEFKESHLKKQSVIRRSKRK